MFQNRGIIEGFYGKPWTWAQRLSLIGRSAKMGFNLFVYGPKDDPYICERWREPYPPEELERLAALKRACDQNAVKLWYLLAPCFSIRYHDAAEFERMMEKYRAVYALGVRTFGLLYDDIPDGFQSEADRAAYADLAEAHVDLGGRVHAALKAMDAGNEMIVCPKDYWGDCDSAYLKKLGAGLPKDIAMFYTGPEVCACTIGKRDLIRFSEATGRKPVLWDNYPVNDSGMVAEFHIGPILGREAGLEAYADGWVVNPMEHLEASMVSLWTFGDYLADSARYDPEKSFQRAAERVVGDAFAGDLAALNAMCYKSCLTRHGGDFPPNGPGSGHHDEFLALVSPLRADELAAWAQKTLNGLRHLRACPNEAFLREAEPWIESAEAFCRAVARALAGDVQPLRAHLSGKCDVMKFEAERLLSAVS